jgi:hypothetical protein
MNPEAKCTAPQPQLRDSVEELAAMLDKANDIAEAIEDKLYGVNQCETCDKACPPNNVQYGINRSTSAIQKLISRLDSISSRL